MYLSKLYYVLLPVNTDRLLIIMGYTKYNEVTIFKMVKGTVNNIHEHWSW